MNLSKSDCLTLGLLVDSYLDYKRESTEGIKPGQTNEIHVRFEGINPLCLTREILEVFFTNYLPCKKFAYEFMGARVIVTDPIIIFGTVPGLDGDRGPSITEVVYYVTYRGATFIDHVVVKDENPEKPKDPGTTFDTQPAEEVVNKAVPAAPEQPQKESEPVDAEDQGKHCETEKPREPEAVNPADFVVEKSLKDKLADLGVFRDETGEDHPIRPSWSLLAGDVQLETGDSSVSLTDFSDYRAVSAVMNVVEVSPVDKGVVEMILGNIKRVFGPSTPMTTLLTEYVSDTKFGYAVDLALRKGYTADQQIHWDDAEHDSHVVLPLSIFIDDNWNVVSKLRAYSTVLVLNSASVDHISKLIKSIRSQAKEV